MATIHHIENGDDNTRVQSVQPRKRPPMSAEQRAKLSIAQRAYVANDPRWAEHRRKLAASPRKRVA